MGFFSDFMGSSAKKDIREADARAKKLLDDGKAEADTRYTEGWDTARGYIDPYAEGGRVGQELYENTLGIHGEGARSGAQDLYYSDPQQEKEAALRFKRVGYKYNAPGGGGYGTGAHGLADARVAVENYGNWQNRLAGVGQQGQQAAQTGATIGYQYGSDRANLAYGNAQQQAGREQSTGNAVAATRSTGINNLLGLAGTAAKAYSSYATGGKTK